jgi:hypothetical protein
MAQENHSSAKLATVKPLPYLPNLDSSSYGSGMSTPERDRIRKVVVVGSPGVQASDFAGTSDVVIKSDPPEGHIAGPKELLESLRTEGSL